MSNLTDALIAAKLMGGSGGSGGGSGLPEITTETVEILAEQSVSFSAKGGRYIGGVPGQYPINVGDNITVTWDGVPYDCVASEVGDFVALGNLSIIGLGDDTGEPFAMSYTPKNDIGMITLSGEVHTVSISGVSYNPPAGSILLVKDGEWGFGVPLNVVAAEESYSGPSASTTITAEELKTIVNAAMDGTPVYMKVLDTEETAPPYDYYVCPAVARHYIPDDGDDERWEVKSIWLRGTTSTSLTMITLRATSSSSTVTVYYNKANL